MAGIALFVCSCGNTLADRIDLAEIRDRIGEHPEVVVVTEHEALCTEDGLAVFRETIHHRELDGVLVAACGQDLFDVTFSPMLMDHGFGPRHIANLDLTLLTEGAGEQEVGAASVVQQAHGFLNQMAAKENAETIEDLRFYRRALVIGGGIAGIQAALDIANAGHEVVLVERDPSIGGHMIQLSETFPSLDCSQCILTPKMAEAGRHPRIRLMTCSEVDGIEGEPGRFKAHVRQNPRYVTDACTSCGDCIEACPAPVCDQFNTGFKWRKAIYQPFPQAVPSIFALDSQHCLGLMPLVCGKCADVCEADAIRYDMPTLNEEIDVGAVVVATGFDLMNYGEISELGLGQIPDVINGLQFERLLSASGPTLGEVVRPSDGEVPKEVVFLQCVHSRSPALGKSYCSGICCMYTAKHSILYKHRVPDGQAYIFYMDIRAGGKGYEEFVQRAMESDGVMYLRGKVSRVYQSNGKVMVCGVDTLIGRQVEIAADLVVLATAVVPNEGHDRIADALGLMSDSHGFLTAAHSKMQPVGTSRPGVFAVGCCQGPRDIPDTVAQASGAAAKVIAMFNRPGFVGLRGGGRMES